MGDPREAALACIDGPGVVRLLQDMIDMPSATGHEAALARFLADRFRRNGWATRLQPVSADSCNAIGTLEGAGRGTSLMLTGHMDTSYTGDEDYLRGFGYRPKAVLRHDKWLFGLGAANMKSGLAAAIGAIEAIARAGVRLSGDLTVAAVAGEIEKAPVDEFQGPEYAGYGTGTKFMLSHGVTADLAICAEPTGFQVSPGHMGSIWAKITTQGDISHTAFLPESKVAHAIEKMTKVQQALAAWIPGYQRRNAFMGQVPAVNTAAIRGGWPWRAARTPAACSLYVDIRTVPGQTPMAVRRELLDVLDGVRAADPDVRASLEFYVINPPVLTDLGHPVVAAVTRAHEALFGQKPEVLFRGPATDSTHISQFGIPTVTYGLGAMNFDLPAADEDERGESVCIDDLLLGVRAYVLAALDLCQRPGPAA